MRQPLQEQARVIWVLVQRDLLIIREGLSSDLINSVINVFATYFTLGILTSYIGFSPTVARDVMIGGICSVLLSRGFFSAIMDSFDSTENRFIDYKRILPLSTAGMLVASLISYVVALLVSSLPLFFLAKLFLGSLMPLCTIQWLPFLIIYLLSMTFISAFFLNIMLTTSFEWFRFNIWQRVLIPLNTLGCFLFSWKRLYQFSPNFARVLLVNPFTYIAEGLRAALFGNEAYISVYYCIPVLLCWTIIAIWILLGHVRKKVEAGS